MKQLVVVVLVAALLSLGYRLAATINADADPGTVPAPKEEMPKEPKPNTSIQPAVVWVDRPSAERDLARNDNTGPNRTRRGDEVSQRSQPVPRSAAKPLAGANANDLATARTPPAPPPQPRTFGPDGIVYHKVGTAPSVVATLRLTPPAEEPPVQAPPPAPLVRDDKPLSPEPLPLPLPTIVPAHGKTVGPDGIEFHPIQLNR